MTPADIARLFVMAISFGATGEAIRQYRGYKARRLARPAGERNAGFWTDGRIVRAEAIFTALVVALPWTAIVSAVSYNRLGLYHVYIGLITYIGMTYLILTGFQPRRPRQ